MTVPHGERVRENATIEWAVGTIFAEADGFYVVVECVPRTSLFGPRWDVFLKPASPEDQLAAEVMLT